MGVCVDILTNCWIVFGRVFSFWNFFTFVEVYWGGLFVCCFSVFVFRLCRFLVVAYLVFDIRFFVGSGYRAGFGRMFVVDVKVLED